jgi:HK97 family phage portal protein
MSFIDRIQKRGLSLTDEKAWDRSLWSLAGTQSIAGEVVDEYRALCYSPVYNAVSLIAGTIGSLPLHLMRHKKKSKSIADDHSAYGIMHGQWNPYMTSMAGRECMAAHILLWGNGFAEITRDSMGRITELWPITPNRVRLYRPDDDKLVYVVRVNSQDVVIPRENMLHIPGLGFDGWTGYSVVSMARKSLGLGMALETFGSLYFGAGTHPGTIVSHPGKLSPTAHTNLQGSLMQTYSGLGKSHKLLLLEEGMKVEKFGIPPDDSQFLESRQFQIPEVARWFNLPPHKLKDLTKSSFSNIESEQISFVTDSILPWLVRLEANYNMQLLSKDDKALLGGRLYFKHIVEGLLRGDSASRGEYYTKMFSIGAMCVNEIREKEDMDPVKGGDKHFVPLNMVSLEEAGKPPPPPVKPVLPVKGNGTGQPVDEPSSEDKPDAEPA